MVVVVVVVDNLMDIDYIVVEVVDIEKNWNLKKK